MDVRIYPNPDEFGPVARWVYRRDPVRFTLELSALLTREWPPGAVLLSVTGPYGLVGAAVQGADHTLLVSGLPAPAAPAVAAALRDHDVRGVRGAESALTGCTATAFAQAWSLCTGAPSVPGRVDVLHELGRLHAPSGAPGHARLALGGDEPLLAGWVDGFQADVAGAAPDPRGCRAFVDLAHRTGGRFVFWEVDGEPVSMARVHAPAAGVARIGPVYTPRRHRRQGFAGAVTAAAAEHARLRGAGEVVLFADAADPVATGVYRRLGFEPVTRYARYRLAGQVAGCGAAQTPFCTAGPPAAPGEMQVS